jgi:hypothetical protein
MLVGSTVSSYGAVGLAAALGVGGGHEGRGEEDGGAHICCVWKVLLIEVIDVWRRVYVQ